ncbi:MAG: hypothetical protein ACLFN5_04905 [bacterium]
MAIEGVGAQALSSQQQSLPLNESAEADEGGEASVQQKVQVSVLKDSMDQAESQTMKLVDSAMGVGQNVDTVA